MIISDNEISARNITSVGGNTRKSITEGTGVARKSITKGSTAFFGTNITSSAYGVGAYGIDEYSGIAHFNARTRPSFSH